MFGQRLLRSFSVGVTDPGVRAEFLWAATVRNLMLGGRMFVGVFLFALLFSRITEANSDEIRAYVLRLLTAPPAARKAAVVEAK